MIHVKTIEEAGVALTDDPTATVVLDKAGEVGQLEYDHIEVTYDPSKNGGAKTPAAAMLLEGNCHYDAKYV